MNILFKAGCFSLFMGIACAGLSSAYAEEKKALAVESAVFDLKSSSSLTVYGNVSDKKRHPVANATVTLNPSRMSSKKQRLIVPVFIRLLFSKTTGFIQFLPVKKA